MARVLVFFGGREATTGNASAVRRLLSEICPTFSLSHLYKKQNNPTASKVK